MYHIELLFYRLEHKNIGSRKRYWLYRLISWGGIGRGKKKRKREKTPTKPNQKQPRKLDNEMVWTRNNNFRNDLM